MWRRASLAAGHRLARSRRQPDMKLPGRSPAPINIRSGPPTATAITSRNGAIVSGTSATLEAFEASFHQDLNGDGVIGMPPQRLIESAGSTSLVEVGNNFFLDSISSGSGPSLKVARRGCCGGPVRRLDADRRGADGKRI